MEDVEVVGVSKRPITSVSINKTMLKNHDFLTPEIISASRSGIKIKPLGNIFWRDGRILDRTDLCCWWDRHQFSTVPIGLPISKHMNCPSQGEDFAPKCYEVEGIFCSFSCALAYRNDQNSVVYKDSTVLLYEMRDEMFGYRIDEPIHVAPSWKELSSYGGKWTITKFREKFGRYAYHNGENMAHMIVQVPCSRYVTKVV